MPIDTITIGAGQSAWLPKGATILSVDATDSLVLTSPSNCIDVTADAKLCYKLSYTYTEDDATTLNPIIILSQVGAQQLVSISLSLA